MKRALEKLPRQERFNSYVYAYNTLLCRAEPELRAQLDRLAEEHAMNWLRENLAVRPVRRKKGVKRA